MGTSCAAATATESLRHRRRCITRSMCSAAESRGSSAHRVCCAYRSWEPIEASPAPLGSRPGIVFLDTSIISMGGRTGQGDFAKDMLSYQAVYTSYLPNTTNQ